MRGKLLYTPKVIAYLVENYGTLPTSVMAKKIGTNRNALTVACASLRKLGHDIPVRPKFGEPKPKQAKLLKPPPKPKQAIVQRTMKRIPKREVVKPTVIRDESLYHWVRVDAKTIKQVKISQQQKQNL